jgi:hypothetical protein
MKTMPKFPLSPAPRRSVAVLAAVFGGLLLTATAAQAFTFSDQPSGGSSDGATKFTDPADRAKSRMNMNGNTGDRTTIQGGNTTFQFGGRESFDQRYDTDRMFSPNNLMGR